MAEGVALRGDCYCANTRKPCQYHEGREDERDIITASAVVIYGSNLEPGEYDARWPSKEPHPYPRLTTLVVAPRDHELVKREA